MVPLQLDVQLALSVGESAHIDLADGSIRLTSFSSSTAIMPSVYRPIWQAILDHCTGEQTIERYIQMNSIGEDKKEEAREEVIDVIRFLINRGFIYAGAESLFDSE